METQIMPIFSRTFDLLAWLLPATNHFPRAHRHSLTSRLLHATFDLRERLEEANIERGPQRLRHLKEADAALANVRMYLRLAHQLTWLSAGQYQHGSAMVVEVGRLLGGWQKTVHASS
jgi:four helix bundle protein